MLQVEVRKNRDDQIKEIGETLSKETERSAELKTKLSESRDTTSQLEATVAEANAEINCLKKDLI